MGLIIFLAALQLAGAVVAAFNAFIESSYGSTSAKKSARRSARLSIILAVTSPLAFIVLPLAALYGCFRVTRALFRLAFG